MKILGLTGVSGVGKDTLANWYCREVGAAHYKFAAVLRAIVYQLGNFDVDRMGDKDYELGWKGGKIQKCLIDYNDFYRPIYPDLFVVSMEWLLSQETKPLVVISDVRQLNELSMVVDRGGQVVRCLRKGATLRPAPLDSLLNNEDLPTLEVNDDPKLPILTTLVNLPAPSPTDKLPQALKTLHPYLSRVDILEVLELSCRYTNKINCEGK